MNSKGRNVDNAQKAAVPLSNYQFDFGLGLNLSGNQASKSLNDQKSKQFQTTSPSPAKPSWVHQPSPAKSYANVWSSQSHPKPTPMAGDISGKSWNSSDNLSKQKDIGIVGGLNKGATPNLFGDLFGEALAKQRSNSSSSNSSSNSSSFSMANVASALPKSGASLMDQRAKAARSVEKPSDKKVGPKTDDPFDSLPTFGSSARVSGSSSFGSSSNDDFPKKDDDGFGEFQKSRTNHSSSADPFSASHNVSESFGFQGSGLGSMPKNTASADYGNFSAVSADPFDSLNKSTSLSGSQQRSNDPLDSLFSSSSSTSKVVAEADDWGLEADFGGTAAESETTTELEGLPPPPPGVSLSMAKNKGMENYKQGQYADAIKWLTWAAVLLEKGADDGQVSADVLTCRASCYKEVGDYKKAIADCSSILEKDQTNASVLLQRALLYESNEKYKLGVADLRSVLKIDPGNRLARNTLSRLIKMVD